jgi:hypothetical protein
VQLDPSVQATQLPALQTMLLPQLEPFGALPVTPHTDAPVEHEVAPTLHCVPAGVQAWPSAQSTHVPALQTLSVPQGVPAVTGTPVSLHVGVPEQTSVPLLQAFAGVQLCPSAHATHAPSLQTCPVPHIVPFGMLPMSMQTGEPVLQASVPVRQGLLTGHVAPTLQAMQVPLLQTLSTPHIVPSGASVAWSTHVGLSPHVCFPAWQGLAGSQLAPSEHVTQSPLLQIIFDPHAVPWATFPVSVQIALPVAHEILASRHGRSGTEHARPSGHATHAPEEHTMPVPQGVPSD